MIEVKDQASGGVAALFEYDSTLGLITSVNLRMAFTISDDPKQLLELEKLINRAIEIGDKMLAGDCKSSQVTLINSEIKEGTDSIGISAFNETVEIDATLVKALREKQNNEVRAVLTDRDVPPRERSAKMTALREKHQKQIAANEQQVRRIRYSYAKNDLTDATSNRNLLEKFALFKKGVSMAIARHAELKKLYGIK